MSVNKRLLGIIPAALVASWLAVRSLGAVPALELDEPEPAQMSTHEILDPALAKLISRLAVDARDGKT
jgi:hypothetical protein